MVAGFSIVLMTIAAVVSTDLTIGSLVVPENPTATFENIKGNLLLFRLGVLSWIIVMISDILVAWGLYIFLRPVNKSISLISAWLRIVYTAILGTSIMNFAHILELFNTEYYTKAFGQVHLESRTWFYLNSFDASWSIGLIVFSLHIFLLGYLGLKSNYIPKLLSIFLIIGCIGYLTIHLSNLLIPEYQNFIQILGWIFILPMLSEVALGFWLLFKGKNIENDYV